MMSAFPNFLLADAAREAELLTQQGANVQAFVAQNFDQLWLDVLLGDGFSDTSSLYGALAKLGTMLAVVAILFWTVQFAKAMLDDATPAPIAQLIWPLILVILLSNNAVVLAKSTLGMRNIIDSANQLVLKTTTASIELDKAYNLVAEALANESLAKKEIAACLDKGDPQEQENCLNQAQKKAEAILSRQGNGPGNPLLEKTKDYLLSAFSMMSPVGFVIAAGLGNVTPLRLILDALGGVYQWGAELALLLTALLGPLAVGATLLPIPGAQKPMIAWITAFFSIGLAKISFNIIVGLTAVVVLNSEPTDLISLMYLMMVGLAAPLLSSLLASGGGKAIFTGLGNGTIRVIGMAVGLAVSGGQIAATREVAKTVAASNTASKS